MTEPVITIVSYQQWMREQIISLTGQEYPFMKDWFETRFHALYESDFLKNRNGIVVALQNNTQVVACISYIYWPLSYRGGLLNSFQMVGLLVDPAVRGKGLFSRVLAAMDTELKSLTPDVVFGFPVEASKKGFLKQGWKNN